MQDATADQIERMNGSCAICWSEMHPATSAATLAQAAKDAGQVSKALPCAHAFHNACIQRWLKQCHEYVFYFTPWSSNSLAPLPCFPAWAYPGSLQALNPVYLAWI